MHIASECPCGEKSTTLHTYYYIIVLLSYYTHVQNHVPQSVQVFKRRLPSLMIQSAQKHLHLHAHTHTCAGTKR